MRRFETAAGGALLLSVVAIFAACGDEDPAGPATGDAHNGAWVDSTLSVRLPEAFTNRDVAGYASLLDERYRYSTCEDTAAVWFREDAVAWFECFAAGGLAIEDGRAVEAVTMNIAILEASPSTSPERPEDEDWFDVEAIVDLVIATRDPDGEGDSGVMNFVLSSNERYSLAKSAGDSARFAIVKQFGACRIDRAGSPPAGFYGLECR